ncbi:hypothetical protein DITRI_Ditri15bG0090000 [Diplodiscus trichospermus]
MERKLDEDDIFGDSDICRADNNWQDRRIKIFPSKGQKSKKPEGTTLVPTPARRKVRPLSSLVVTTPRVSARAGLTGRRLKLSARKTVASQESPLVDEEHEFSVAEYPSKMCLTEAPKALEEKADLSKPLNRLMETASKIKPIRAN